MEHIRKNVPDTIVVGMICSYQVFCPIGPRPVLRCLKRLPNTCFSNNGFADTSIQLRAESRSDSVLPTAIRAMHSSQLPPKDPIGTRCAVCRASASAHTSMAAASRRPIVHYAPVISAASACRVAQRDSDARSIAARTVMSSRAQPDRAQAAPLRRR